MMKSLFLSMLPLIATASSNNLQGRQLIEPFDCPFQNNEDILFYRSEVSILGLQGELSCSDKELLIIGGFLDESIDIHVSFSDEDHQRIIEVQTQSVVCADSSTVSLSPDGRRRLPGGTTTDMPQRKTLNFVPPGYNFGGRGRKLRSCAIFVRFPSNCCFTVAQMLISFALS